MSTSWQKERQVAEQAAIQAGEKIRTFFRQEMTVKEKSPKNYLTEADLAANTIIQKTITQNFPEDGWISEETEKDHAALTKDRLWVVDPLDGTYEFVHGVPEFAISIGFVAKGVPVMGVVYNPVQEELFSGSSDEGVFLNGVSRKLSPCQSLGDASFLVSRTEFDKKRLDFLKERLKLNPKGGTAYKLALVAVGVYDGNISVRPKNNWDFAAGMALIKAAGGAVSDIHEGAQPLDKLPEKVSGLCTGNLKWHGELLRLVQDGLKKAF